MKNMICPGCEKEIDAYLVVKAPICFTSLCRIKRQTMTGCSSCSWNC